MHGKRRGAMGVVLALLTLVASLFCAAGASAAPAGAAPSAAVTDLCEVPLPHTSADVGHGVSAPAADAPCLKKSQPAQQPLASGVPFSRVLPAEADVLPFPRAVQGDGPHRCPAHSPPDLAELSVRRV